MKFKGNVLRLTEDLYKGFTAVELLLRGGGKVYSRRFSQKFLTFANMLRHVLYFTYLDKLTTRIFFLNSLNQNNEKN